jgi:hypothetical protein
MIFISRHFTGIIRSKLLFDRPRLGAVLATVLAAVVFGLAAPASAQDTSYGKQIYRNKINCPQCHGWAGDGQNEDPRAPKGPSLRETALDEDALKEVIKCGLIGTAMPHFDRLAYTDTRCYGVTAADIGNDKPPQGAQTLILREINGLVDYLLANVIGAGEPTREQCIAFFEEVASRCEELPAAGG